MSVTLRLPTRLPVFPLPCVVFPGEEIPLHVFEERYKALVRDCLAAAEGGLTPGFGITCVTEETTYSVGSLVVIQRILKEYPTGELDVTVRGASRFRINDIDRSELYPTATVDYFDDPAPPDGALTGQAVALHMKLLELAKGEPRPPVLDPADRASFYLARGAGLSVDQRQSVLEMTAEADRLSYLIRYYQEVIPVLEHNRDVKERVAANGYLRKLKSGSL